MTRTDTLLPPHCAAGQRAVRGPPLGHQLGAPSPHPLAAKRRWKGRGRPTKPLRSPLLCALQGGYAAYRYAQPAAAAAAAAAAAYSDRYAGDLGTGSQCSGPSGQGSHRPEAPPAAQGPGDGSPRTAGLNGLGDPKTAAVITPCFTAGRRGTPVLREQTAPPQLWRPRPLSVQGAPGGGGCGQGLLCDRTGRGGL